MTQELGNPTIAMLHARGPDPALADRMRLYAFLPGDWSFDAEVFTPDGERKQAQGEIHAGWVLGGRAIQDVWILPGFFFGTTLRVYDPGLDAWHILWNDPLKQLYTSQIGRAEGDEIVQLGESAAGERIRWRFFDLAPDSFRWRGERFDESGGDWRLQADFRVRRA